MSDFDAIDFFTSTSLAQDPYPYFEYLRTKGPVYREPHHGVFVVTGYEEAVAVFKDHKSFSSCNSVTGPFPPLPFQPEGNDIGDLIERTRHQMPLNQFISTQDGARHAESRALMMRAFVPSRMKDVESLMRTVVDQQIDKIVARGGCELISDYAHGLAIVVISDLIGVPSSDRDDFRPRIKGDLDGFANGDQRESAKMPHNHFKLLEERFGSYIEERRRHPRKDVLSDLAAARLADGSSLDVVELARIATYLFVAGQDTAALLLAAVFRVLGERLDLQQQLRDEPHLIPSFIEEALRLESPVKSIFRLARTPATIGGVDIPVGATVMILAGAVNRDPRRFQRPDQILFDRPKAKDHLSFGRGVHACPGNHLARAQAQLTLERLLDRAVTIGICEARHGPPEARRYEFDATYVLRKLKALHLQFTPALN